MSGGPHHNPHGRPGQPASAWNHLQVPNYFPPRQPQVAHMSSERPLSHSPLTWHTPTPPDHPQGGKPAYRHTPTPPDLQALKQTPAQLYRHTPTPPDRDALKSYRHTPTPPDSGPKGASYRHTPTPPDALKPLYHSDPHKPPPSPLFNLQQMISDNRSVQAQRLGESLRDNLTALAVENFSRRSPSLALGSVDLSVTRSPRNGNQNGEMGLPVGLSVRDATTINSLDSAEITKIHQVPAGYLGKGMEITKASSPTLGSANRNSNGPDSPKSTGKRPLKKMDSILERLNSGGDGVVITPVRLPRSPHSVIVSAHSLEDGNSRGSSSSISLTPAAGSQPYPACEPTAPRVPQPLLLHGDLSDKRPSSQGPHSVIIESVTISRERPLPPSTFVDVDSDGSSGDSSKSKRRRKQIKTSRVDNSPREPFPSSERDQPTIPPPILNDEVFRQRIENHSEQNPSCVRIQALPPRVEESTVPRPEFATNTEIITAIENGVPPAKRRSSSEDSSVPVVSKTRRKTSSESETIDNIAAMIASTNSADSLNEVSTTTIVPSASNSIRKTDEAESKQTDNLRQVLGSPESESKLESKQATPQTEINSKPQRRKKDDLSNSTDSSQNDKDKIPNKDETINDEEGNSKPQSSSFVEVENELEKMFAGIGEEVLDSTRSSTLDPVTGLMIEHNANTSSKNPSAETFPRKKRVSRRSSGTVSIGTPSGDENTPKKKRKSNKHSLTGPEGEHSNNIDVQTSKKSKKNKESKSSKGNKKDKLKGESLSHKDAYDSGSNASSSKSRGPYVQIRGPRDSPLSVNIINAPVQEEDSEKTLQKIKNPKAKSLVSDGDFRNKVKSKGLHGSTLSAKYDAATTDASWICVFCKRGPHRGNPAGAANPVGTQPMGDLFGPYIISTDCPDYGDTVRDSTLEDRGDRGSFPQNRRARLPGKRPKRETEPSEAVSDFPVEEMYLGMKEAGPNCYEVWVHEDCAVWAPGLHLIGAKVAGLEGAVWACCRVRCEGCGLAGASVACAAHGCRRTLHVQCARAHLWVLSEEDFHVRCPRHAAP